MDISQQLRELQYSPIHKKIEQRIKEFKRYQYASHNDIFLELCFCLMTASCPAERCLQIQQILREEFLHLSSKDLEKKLRDQGYRFPNRAPRITAARKQLPQLSQQLSQSCGRTIRQWLVENIHGLGYKEASHFLRNIGYDDVAIIDVHILRILEKHGMISAPKTLTKKRYLTIEKKLEELADHTGLTLAELDLYLWYIQTGKILK